MSTIGQIQDELYIVAGVLGAICFVLLIMIVIALIWTYRLRVTVEKLKERLIARAYRNAGPQSVEDFENPRRLPRFDSQPPLKKFVPPPPMQQQQQQQNQHQHQNDWGNGGHVNKGMNPLSNSHEHRGFPGDSRYPSRPRNLGY
ncbi:PREDICTED: uncharacterized protein LOC108565308 [Nicrophorus vespilloides]|uniref:Uncharacterized protein LOC108565308 n=1 Tax=Nicrophorus vespilloides TaxID=110193 RepID=A0ABM1N037_NICVS|nr:PREDICTED: uncharacterized protein LOC108565308 [Nicrophorus vespilloides]